MAYPSVTDILAPQFPHRRWTKAEDYNSITRMLLRKQRPRLSSISLVLDKRPGLTRHKLLGKK